MSGGNIAYHLRPNKAVDRALFLDLLTRIGRVMFNISEYRYVGFGGPFMEDFRAIHAATRISKMVCIERSEVVQSRQKFNCPLSCVDFMLADSSSFLDEFSFDDPTVVWLDFTSPGELKQQLDDSSKLAKKLAHGDIFKVTLNASVSALRNDRGSINQKELLHLRRREFEERVGVDKPQSIKDDEFKPAQYPTLLLRALTLALQRGVNVSKLVIQPLSAFTYSDGTQMLTATGIVLDPAKMQPSVFADQSRLRYWPFSSLDWKFPMEIDLPVLSLKERMALESIQPNGTVVDADKIGLTIAPEAIPPAAVKSFGSFYRVYPDFVRVAL